MAVIRNYAYLSCVNVTVANTSLLKMWGFFKYLKTTLTYANTKKLRAD